MNVVALNILAQYLSSVLWGIYIGLEQLSQGMCTSSGLVVADSFPKWLHQVLLPPVACEHFRCSTASPIFFYPFDVSHSDRFTNHPYFGFVQTAQQALWLMSFLRSCVV